MNEWNKVKPAMCAKWLVLPTVYSDALSYGEQLDKFCYQLNKIIENNNILPDYISEMIQSYISSGAIGEVVREILANYILNVKYPPEGIKPAIGDGSEDDTEAIQGCIDYASKNGGVVYFPYGSYLTQPITMKSNVSLFGFDRYSTKVVLKGGATKALLNGNVNGLSVIGLTLDGNSGIQVNDVGVVNLTGADLLFNELIIKDGYHLFEFTGDGRLQVNDIVFGNAVENCFSVAGNVKVQAKGLSFSSLSKVGGIDVINIGANGGTYEFDSTAICDECLFVNGSDNKIVASISGANTDYNDMGERNNIEIIGKSDKRYYSGSVKVDGGSADVALQGGVVVRANNATGEFNGNVKVDAKNSEVTLQGTRSLHVIDASTFAVDGNSTESVDGNKSEVVTGVTIETYKNTRTTNDSNLNENVSGKKKEEYGVLEETVNGNFSKIITGITTETYEDDRNITEKNVTEIATKKIVNANDIVLSPVNPLTYGVVVEGSPFNYVEYKDKNNDIYQVLVSKGEIIDALPILDVTKFGVLPNGIDMTDKLNELIETYYEDFTIYMKKGKYTFNGTINIEGYRTKLICDGEIYSTASIALNVKANSVELSISKLSGNNIAGSCGLLVGGELTNSIGNGTFNLPSIDKFNTGIILKGNHGFGVQNNNFLLNRIDHFKVGIGIECGDGLSWVNENRFYNCWTFGYEGNGGTEIGVKFTKGVEQTDPFNGNRFINFSCEGCATMFELHFAQRNSFVDFRMIEQDGNKQIVCDSESNDNMFSSNNAMIDYKAINDASVNNIYNMRFYSDGKLVCTMGTFAFGVFMPIDVGLEFSNTNYTFNGNNATIPSSSPLRYLTISNSTDNKITVILPLCINYPQVMNHEFYIETGDISGGVTLSCYGGQVFSDTNTNIATLIGYHLESWTKYIIRCVGVLTWKVIPILPQSRVSTGVTPTANGKVSDTQQNVTIIANSALTY